jgi:hypothetical protein
MKTITSKPIRSREALKSWTEAELRERLDIEVVKLNRRRAIGGISDHQVGDLLSLEIVCRLLGNEIKERRAGQ